MPNLLRAVIRSTSQHDWFTSITEFFLLVAGIFLGFQLDRWNDDRIDQIQADEYGMQLLEDLTASRIEMQTRIDYYETVKEWGLKALTAWDTEPVYSPEELIIAFYQASNDIPSSSFRGAYDALTLQGLAVLIDGPEFASRLSAYYSQPLDQFLDAESPYRTEIRSIMPVEIQVAVRENCATVEAAGLVTETLLSQCQIDIPPAKASELLEKLISQPGLQEKLTYSVSNNTLYRYVLDIKIEDATNITGTLQEIYGGQNDVSSI